MLERVKFLAPLKPDSTYRVTIERTAESQRYQFQFSDESHVCTSGTIRASAGG